MPTVLMMFAVALLWQAANGPDEPVEPPAAVAPTRAAPQEPVPEPAVPCETPVVPCAATEPPEEVEAPPPLPEPPEGLSEVQEQVWRRLQHHGREDEFDCLAEIYVAESSWRPDALGDRDRGGSHGLPQRHAPAHGAPPSPWPVEDQVDWSLEYADERYGGVCEAAAARREQGWW